MGTEANAPYKDSFGFLPKPVSIHFDGGEITPVDNYDEVTACVHESSHENGAELYTVADEMRLLSCENVLIMCNQYFDYK